MLLELLGHRDCSLASHTHPTRQLTVGFVNNRRIPCFQMPVCARCWWRWIGGLVRISSLREAEYPGFPTARWWRPFPRKRKAFRRSPEVTYNGLLHTWDLYDFVPSFQQGILTTLPPEITESAYPALIPLTDPDGNDVTGIRLPEIAVPLATYTGWALRAGPAANDGCDASGQQIAFAKTRPERDASGDPRLSIKERYKTHEGYVRHVEKAVRMLLRERVLLEEDAARYIEAAEASEVLR